MQQLFSDSRRVRFGSMLLQVQIRGDLETEQLTVKELHDKKHPQLHCNFAHCRFFSDYHHSTKKTSVRNSKAEREILTILNSGYPFHTNSSSSDPLLNPTGSRGIQIHLVVGKFVLVVFKFVCRLRLIALDSIVGNCC